MNLGWQLNRWDKEMLGDLHETISRASTPFFT